MLAMASGALAETCHQKAEGAEAYSPDGGKAAEKGLLEVKETPGSSSGKVARTKENLPQWGFVSYWFGIPAPAGKATLRFRVYVDGQKASEFGIYAIAGGKQIQVGKLAIPADAKQGSFIDVDVPFEMSEEWSGVAFKKLEDAKASSPWIDSISVILP